MNVQKRDSFDYNTPITTADWYAALLNALPLPLTPVSVLHSRFTEPPHGGDERVLRRALERAHRDGRRRAGDGLRQRDNRH